MFEKEFTYKKTQFIAFGLATLMSVQALPTIAFESDNLNDTSVYAITKKSTLLSPEKEKQLLDIAKEVNLGAQEIQELRNLYNEHSATIMPRGRIGVVLKVVKAAKPVILKACKMFGVKMGEKTLSDLTDFLFEWQGSLQDGIENFLIDHWNWNKTAAHWTAKTIMFVVF